MRYTLPLLLCLISPLASLEVLGRDGKPLYRLEVPEGWERIETSLDKISDTREPLVTWRKGHLEARLHSFPLNSEIGSIPPEAQVTRWLRKFPKEPLYEVLPISQGGFKGLLLIAADQEEAFFGAAFSLGKRGVRAFRGHSELSSDWTFIVKGERNELLQEKIALIEWFETLKLLFEIPHADL